MVTETIQAIIFDFGGVFTRSKQTEAWLKSYDALLDLPPGTIQNALYSGEDWELASTGRISPEVHWERTGKLYEKLLPAKFAQLRHGLFCIEPVDEAVVRLAQRLRSRYPLALCSNALNELEDVLSNRTDLRDLFDVVVVSSLVGLRKPDPAILELTAGRLGLPPQACLLIDDKRRNTSVAETLGMQTIVFDSAEQLARELEARGLLLQQEG